MDASALLALASGPTILLAVMNSGSVFAGVTWSSTVVHLYNWARAADALLQLLWLAWLLGRRLSASGRSTRHRAVMIASLAVLGAPVMAGPVLQLPGITFTAGLLLRTVLLAWLACEICLRHNIPLSRPVTSSERLLRRHTAFRQTSMVASYCLLGAGATSVAVFTLRWLGPGWLPVMRTDQASALGATSRADLLVALPWTVVLEGVTIGTVSLLLHTAGRSTVQIYTIIAVPEIIFHAYFGLPAVLMAVYAVLCCHFYLRYHRLGPLLLGHALYDLLGMLAGPWPVVYRIPLGAVIGIAWLAAERWVAAPPRSRTAPVL
ncbi:hypothetical protein [Streptomyces olivaceus]|uniref:hypothetical protein n=1 Tax=Streptomyces olivaceus TaxID=47716 RepID=UPI0037AE78F1